MNCVEKVLAGKVQYREDTKATDVQAIRIAQSTPIVEATNVADFVLEGQLVKEQMGIYVPGWMAKEFPGSFPPWRAATIAFQLRLDLIKDTWTGDTRITRTPGVDVAVMYVTGKSCDGALYKMLGLVETQGGKEHRLSVDAKHVFLGMVYIAGAGGLAFRSGYILTHYNEDKEIVATQYYEDPWWSSAENEAYGLSRRLEAIAAASHAVVTASHSFANCKNVDVEKVALSRQVRRRAERLGNPVFEHHVIRIDPMRRILESEGGLSQHGDLRKSLHMCRGHFARYGREYGTGKLFGKHEGQFWVSQHVRGSLDRGVITKDYKVASGGAK